MNRVTWLVLLATYLLVSTSFATPSRTMDSPESAAPVQQAPSAPLPARYVGATVITNDEPLALRAVWGVDAAGSGTAPSGFVWRLDDRVVSSSPELVLPLTTPGDYLLHMRYDDFHGRVYETQIPVRVMEPEEYNAMKVAVLAAAQLPLWLEEDEIFLPFVEKGDF